MLGAIVTSYNDGFKLKEWREHYDEMKSMIDYYIIIDNGSTDKDYLSKMKSIFHDAKIIELDENRGTTGAYNIGISYLLKETNTEYIMLIGNDIKISCESIEKQIGFLESHDDAYMVAPVLLKKNSMIVEDGGCYINAREYSLKPVNVGIPYQNISHEAALVDTVTGGMNIAKRSFYETVGLQDEKLFMYSDEVDMGLRAKKHGLKMYIVAEACAWHQHINPKNTTLRHPYSAFLMGRNKIYLAKKHGKHFEATALFFRYIRKDILPLIIAVIKADKEKEEWFRWHLIGALHGIRNDMRKNRYSSLEG